MELPHSQLVLDSLNSNYFPRRDCLAAKGDIRSTARFVTFHLGEVSSGLCTFLETHRRSCAIRSSNRWSVQCHGGNLPQGSLDSGRALCKAAGQPREYDSRSGQPRARGHDHTYCITDRRSFRNHPPDAPWRVADGTCIPGARSFGGGVVGSVVTARAVGPRGPSPQAGKEPSVRARCAVGATNWRRDCSG